MATGKQTRKRSPLSEQKGQLWGRIKLYHAMTSATKVSALIDKLISVVNEEIKSELTF